MEGSCSAQRVLRTHSSTRNKIPKASFDEPCVYLQDFSFQDSELLDSPRPGLSGRGSSKRTSPRRWSVKAPEPLEPEPLETAEDNTEPGPPVPPKFAEAASAPTATPGLSSAVGRHLELLGLALQRGRPSPLAAEATSEESLRPALANSAEALAQELFAGADAASSCLQSNGCFSTSPCFHQGQATVVAGEVPVSSCVSGSLDSREDCREDASPKEEEDLGKKCSEASVLSLPAPSRALSSRGWDSIKRTEDEGRLKRFVMSHTFESLFACLILVNTVVMVVEEQYYGSVTGYQLTWYEEYGSDSYNRQYMPSAEKVFRVSEIVFATIFTLEAMLRMRGRGKEYWKDKSELMDLFVVVCSNASLIVESYATINITLFRLLRLAKLLRIVKLIRTVEQLDSLQLMTTALYASYSALCWAVILLFVMQTFVALILTNILRHEYLLSDRLSDEQKQQLFEYFGTYARAMLSTFELMLANWPPICRFMTETLHEGWMVVVIAYKLTFGFAFISVINAVFMQETLNVAVTDDNIMIRTKMRSQQDFRKKMQKLLKLADTNGDGFLSLAEFKAVLHNPGVKMWLESMDMETRDGTLLFRLLDKDGDDSLSVDELAMGFSKLKGQAKSLDTQLIVHALRKQWFPDVERRQGDELLIDEMSKVLSPQKDYTATL